MPMRSSEFRQYASKLNLSHLAINYIDHARSSNPARRVESVGEQNTVWRYPSDKMGFAVSLESSEEHALAVQLEYDPDVLEYWDQPPREVLLTLDAKGTRRRTPYVPDFLVLRRQGVEVVQVKPAEACQRLARLQPKRWIWDGQVACDIAALEHFSGIGLPHVVYVAAQAHKMRVENYELMLRLRDIPVDLATVKKLGKALAASPEDAVLSMSQLMLASGITTATPIVQFVDRGVLFTDLDRWRLSVADECLIAKSRQTIDAYTSALFAMTVDAQPVTQLSSAELQEAHHRLRVLRGELPPHRSPRSVLRWRSRLHQAGGNPISLGPHHRLKGNRMSRLSTDELAVLESSLGKHYLDVLSTSILAAYSQYLVDQEVAVSTGKLPRSSAAVSYRTYSGRCRQVPPDEVAKVRSGKRAAAAAAHPVDPTLKRLSPVRVFARAHIDHYLCDLHVIVAESSKKHTLRPQLTAMRDEATGAILAISLSFNPPSCYSCQSVIRDCARRHGRLPETVVVDNGAEFHSEYFEVALARLGVAIQRRPPGSPRYGSAIEGWFHSLKAFLSAQRGNTNNDARGRAASTEHKGRSHAAWNIGEAYRAIEAFTFDAFNVSTSVSDMDSRASKSAAALSKFPESGVSANFNAEFLAITAIPLKKMLKIDMARGIRHLGRWFSHPKLFHPQLDGKRLRVFDEPWDMNTLYALVDGALVPCRHGSMATAELSTDFTPALDSIRHLECAGVRANLRKEASIESAKLIRALAAPNRIGMARKNEPTKRKRQRTAPGEVRPLPVEYWP